MELKWLKPGEEKVDITTHMPYHIILQYPKSQKISSLASYDEMAFISWLIDCAGDKKTVLSLGQSAEVGAVMEVDVLTEQQLGLRQAEERLYRDYIHRLVKVSYHYPYEQDTLCSSLLGVYV